MVTFHVGHHKTATTWLQDGLFSQHPQICLLNDHKKPWNNPVLHYVVTESERSYNYEHAKSLFQNSILMYRNCGRRLLYSAERLSGHPMSGGIDSYRTAKRLYSLCPDAKIIIGIRGQRTMLASIYTQLLKAGYCGSFSSLLSQDNWKTPGFNLDYLKFDKLVGLYISLFGASRIQVLFYEDLLIDKQAYLNSITNFMNIDTFIPSNFDAINNSSANVNLISLATRNVVKTTSNGIAQFGIELGKDLEQGMQEMISNACKELTIDSLFSIPTDLERMYSQSNESLFNMLGIVGKSGYS
ncbi:sulfotransferase [Shewanella japonica]|uniref:sulfotransferase n=1 Tax=Shewanella japonica TaxID=93973 RepID=UPI002494A999|nr:sulfotransferase [Shewanella japonica]